MANLPEDDLWEPGIRQFETTDLLLGGPSGVDNIPLKQLTNRTLYLKTLLEQLDSTNETEHATFKSDIASLQEDTLSEAESDAKYAKIEAGNPPGTIIMLGHNPSTPPDGYIFAEPSTLNRADFPELWAVIEPLALANTGNVPTQWGVGNGSTTFTVPDMRGDFLRNYDNGRGVDVGRVFGVEQSDAIRNITGGATGRNSFADTYITFGANIGAIGSYIPNATTGLTSTVSGGSTPYGVGLFFDASRVVPTASENRPINQTVRFCIKY